MNMKPSQNKPLNKYASELGKLGAKAYIKSLGKKGLKEKMLKMRQAKAKKKQKLSTV